MQLAELRTFLAIIETGSLVRASERLNVTQSTVTARLKSLEEEIGQTLMHRQKSGTTLTAAGVRLRSYASTICDLWQQAQQETHLPDAMSAVCNIGCHPDLWVGLGEHFFDHIRLDLPQVALSIWHGNERDLSDWLNDGLIDVSFTYLPNASQSQDVVRIHEDRLVLVSTDKNSPTKFDPGYVFVEAGEEFGRDHAIAYADANTARLSFGTINLGLNHILQNGGTAYLPERIVTQHLASKQLFKLEQAPVFNRQAYLHTNKTARNSWSWFDDCLSVLSTGVNKLQL